MKKIISQLHMKKIENNQSTGSSSSKMKFKKLSYLGLISIFSNYDVFSFLERKGMKINNCHINEAAKIGNLFLVEYFLEKNQILNDILVLIRISKYRTCQIHSRAKRN